MTCNGQQAGSELDRQGGPCVEATAQEPAGRKPSLVVNALSSWAGFVVTVLAGFLLTPFVIHHLGKSGYGIWCLVGSVIGYYGLLDLGVSSAVRRYVAKYAARKDYELLNETVSTAVTVFAGAGVLMILISVLFGRALAAFFEVTGSAADAFYAVVVILGVSAAANIIGQVFRATVAAHEYFVARNAATIGMTGVRAGLTVAALMSGWGLVGVALAYCLVDILGFLAYIVMVKRLTPHVKLRLGQWRWRRARSLFTFGLTMTVIVGAGIVQTHTASAVLAKIVGLEAVAIYAVAALLMRHFSNLINAGMGVVSPRFAGLHGVHDEHNLRRLLIKSLWVSSMLSCAVALAMLILGPRFLDLWVGARFTPSELAEGTTVLMVLVLAYMLGLSQTPGATVLYAMNRHRVYACIMIAEAGCNLIVGIILARRMGAVGVAAGCLISMLGIRMLAQPLYTAKVLGLTVRQYCTPMLVSFLTAAAVWGAWQWLIWPRMPALGYLGLLLASAGIALTYLAALTAVQAGVDLSRGRRLRLAAPFVSAD